MFATQFVAAPPPQYGGRLTSVLELLGTRNRLIRSAEQADVLPLRSGPLLFDRRGLGDERLRAGQYLRSCLTPLRAPRPDPVSGRDVDHVLAPLRAPRPAPDRAEGRPAFHPEAP